MRLSRSLVALATMAVVAVALIAAACGGDDGGPAASDEPQGPGPSSSGLVADNVFMTFEGQRYQLREVLKADLISDEFSELGAATDADIEHQGELTVFRRAGDDTAVYTFSPAVDAEGEEGDIVALWQRWELAE